MIDVKKWQLGVAAFLCACAFSCSDASEACAAEVPEQTAVVPAEAEQATETKNVVIAPIERREVGIVMLGSGRYLEPVYQDILNRFFVRCYSQYRYPTEFGMDMQYDFQDCQGDMASSDDYATLLESMEKDMVLFLDVKDAVYQRRRSWGWDWRSDDIWEAYVQVNATLVDKNGVVKKDKFYRNVDGKYSPGAALEEAYTYCIRKMQQKKYFQ